MTLIQTLTLFLGVLTIGSFAWSLAAFFKIPQGGVPAEMRHLKAAGSVCALAHFVLLAYPGQVVGERALAAIILYCFSLSLFWWAIWTNHKRPLWIAFTNAGPEHLVSSGPYRFIRHPFYTSYSLAWIAGIFATGRWELISTVMVMGVFYYRAAKFEESQFSKSSLSEVYTRYRRQTGMFFPSAKIFSQSSKKKAA